MNENNTNEVRRNTLEADKEFLQKIVHKHLFDMLNHMFRSTLREQQVVVLLIDDNIKKIQDIKKKYNDFLFQMCRNTICIYYENLSWENEERITLPYICAVFLDIDNQKKEIESLYLRIFINEYFRFIKQHFLVFDKAEIAALELFLTRNENIIILRAEKRFYQIMYETFNVNIRDIIAISGTYYEGSSCSSSLIYIFADNLILEKGVVFKQPIEISKGNIRLIRKILQMGRTEGHAVIAGKVDGKYVIIGLMDRNIEELVRHGSYLEVQFQQHMVWKMALDGRTIIKYDCGEYVLESEGIEQRVFMEKYKEVFEKAPGDSILKIYAGAKKQKHGALVVIMDDSVVDSAKGSVIDRELDRLQKESISFGIEKDKWSGEYLESVTSIDGAAFFDTSGKCYATGVVLDGKKSEECKRERGSRYNSAQRYISWCKEKEYKALIVIVSEDRMVEVIYSDGKKREKD